MFFFSISLLFIKIIIILTLTITDLFCDDPIQGRSQEFQKGVSINGRMSIKQGSVGVQFLMLMNSAHVQFEFNTLLPKS